MIAVSNEFKKAIKNAERKIKGYVEVLYDVKAPTVNTSSNMTSSYTELSDIKQGDRVKQNYGTIDYLPLDGSYLTMDASNNTNSGFISDELSGAETGRTITLSFASTTLNGITIYYKNNLPESAYLTLSDGTTATIPAPEDNGSGEYMQQYIFSSPKTLTSITIEYNLWRYETRKVRIPRIDLGLSAVYKDQDLIEFTVDEEVNKLVEEVPTNETNVTINNIYDLFNPLNPQGVVKYLTEGSKIIPYIGVLTETQGVEYVKMGEFYFDSYTNNSDKTTTLVGKNIIKEIEKKEVTDGLVGSTSVFIDLVGGSSPNLTTDIFNRLGYSYEFNPKAQIAYNLNFLETVNLMEFIKNLTIHDYSIFYANRNNKLIFRNPVSSVIETLTKSDLIKDVEYKKIDRVNTIKRISSRQSSQSQSTSGTNTTIFSSTDKQYVIKKSTQNFAIKNDVSRNIWLFPEDSTFTYSGASNAQIKYGSTLYTIIQVTGTVGNTVSLNCVYNNHTVSNQNLEETHIVSNKQTGESETIIENNMTFNAYPGRVKTDLGQLEYTPSYEISFEYNGDPSLEAGDYINVETPYGYKPVFIQKNTFRYNGGLSGNIEGVE